jgi:myo-inositol 2-dehydrogenase/D-chiro-inositol 1-dehydrogenase
MALRVGFIGCGGIGRWHMEHLAAIRGVKMVAFCDTDKARAGSAAEEFGDQAQVFTDYHQMYKDSCFDAVYVCLPPFAHEEQELLAAKAGIHLFVEKPIALDLKLAKSVERAVARAGIISSAGFQDRYLDTIARLEKELASNPPGLMMGYWMGGMPGVYWWRRKELSGGQAVEQTIHIFDMARYLFGEIRSVQAVASKGLMKDVPKYNVEDASAVNLKFKSGLCGTIFSACFSEAGHKTGIDVWSREAAFQYKERGTLTILRKGKKDQVIEQKNDYATAIDKAFINAINKQDQSELKSSYSDAVKSLAVVLAANESMKTGETVKV